MQPEGDPAQHLVEEVLFRAAKKAGNNHNHKDIYYFIYNFGDWFYLICSFSFLKSSGLDFHELLEIPQGDRRRYHDDVSIIVISLEGRIWRSCV